MLLQQSLRNPVLKVHKYLDRPESYSPATSLPRQTRVILAPVFLRTLFQLEVSAGFNSLQQPPEISLCFVKPLFCLLLTTNCMHRALFLPSKRAFARKDIVLAFPEAMILMDIWPRLGDEVVCL